MAWNSCFEWAVEFVVRVLIYPASVIALSGIMIALLHSVIVSSSNRMVMKSSFILDISFPIIPSLVSMFAVLLMHHLHILSKLGTPLLEHCPQLPSIDRIEFEIVAHRPRSGHARRLPQSHRRARNAV